MTEKRSDKITIELVEPDKVTIDLVDYSHMKAPYLKKGIIGIIDVEKELTDLDEFVLDIHKILGSLRNFSSYVISGEYILTLFGRSSTADDIHFIVEEGNVYFYRYLMQYLEKKGYDLLQSDLLQSDLLQSEDENEMYELLNSLGIRVVKKGMISPNIELKFAKNDFERYSLYHKLRVMIKSHSLTRPSHYSMGIGDVWYNELYIPPMELLIPYKLCLGSEKDIEDAIYLWKIFKDKDSIDLDVMNKFMKEFKIGERHGIGE